MIPIPPTSSEIPTIPASTAVATRLMLLNVVEDLVLGPDVEVVRLVGRQPVPAAEEVDDLRRASGTAFSETACAVRASFRRAAGYIFRAIV